MQDLPLSLRYQLCLDIQHKREGLREPSGLALSPKTHTLWTVSDDTKRIFCLDSEGTIQHHQTFAIPAGQQPPVYRQRSQGQNISV